MATEPVLQSNERIQEIVYRKRRHDLGFATGDEKMCVNNAVRLIRDDLPDLLDHIAALTAILRGVVHCTICDGEGILFSEDNQPYACDCRVNAKKALGEE